LSYTRHLLGQNLTVFPQRFSLICVADYSLACARPQRIIPFLLKQFWLVKIFYP